MGCVSRDRTTEFRTFGKSFESRAKVDGFQNPKRQVVLAESAQFNQLAKRIGHDLSQTCAKMEQMTEMAKRKGIFSDRTHMEHISRIIKEDITSLNKQIAILQEYSRRRHGSLKSQGGNHSHQVIVGLQSKLANMSKDYQCALQLNTENLKTQQTRMGIFSNATQFSSLPMSKTPNVSSKLLAANEDHYKSENFVLDMATISNMQDQQTIMNDQSQEYAQSRANAMGTIESSISELGQIFTQLASLVSEQGELITRIDSNVEETSMNVDAAHTELVKYFHNISRNRWLMLKIFGCLMGFAVIFILFLV